jgi:hypothetical protein
MPSVLIHIQNEDAVLGEIDALPGANDTTIVVKNPRKKDGKDLTFLDANASTVVWPLHRVNFIEILSGEEEEEIITFVRE